MLRAAGLLENVPIFRSQTLTEWEFVRSKLAKGLEMVRKKKVHTFFIFNSVIEFWAEFSKNVSFHCFLFDDGSVILNHFHVKYDWQMLDPPKKNNNNNNDKTKLEMSGVLQPNTQAFSSRSCLITRLDLVRYVLTSPNVTKYRSKSCEREESAWVLGWGC